MKIGSRELLNLVKQPKQLEMFPLAMSPIEKFYMDYALQVSEQINKTMQVYVDMALLQPVHSKTLSPTYGSNIKDFFKSHPQWKQEWKPDWDSSSYVKATGISTRDYCNNVKIEYAANPKV